MKHSSFSNIRNLKTNKIETSLRNDSLQSSSLDNLRKQETNINTSHSVINKSKFIHAIPLIPQILEKKVIETKKRQSNNFMKSLEQLKILQTERSDSEFCVNELRARKMNMRKNKENLYKLYKLKEYDKEVISLSKIHKILRGNSNKSPKNYKLKNSKKLDLFEDDRRNLTKTSEAIVLNSLFLTNVKESGRKVSNLKTEINKDNSNDVEEDKKVQLIGSAKLNPISRSRLKFLEIYKTSVEKEKLIRKIKKNKTISLEKYQQNLVNIISDTIPQAALYDLVNKLNEIVYISQSKNNDNKSNEMYYPLLINLMKKELKLDDYQSDENLLNQEKKFNEIKHKYIKKEKYEKKMELMKTILPSYLYDKLRNLK